MLCVYAQSLQHCLTLCNTKDYPACQAPLSMGFSPVSLALQAIPLPLSRKRRKKAKHTHTI